MSYQRYGPRGSYGHIGEQGAVDAMIIKSTVNRDSGTHGSADSTTWDHKLDTLVLVQCHGQVTMSFIC